MATVTQPPAQTSTTTPTPEVMACLRCTFANPLGSTTCEMCQSPLPALSPNPSHTAASNAPRDKVPSPADRPSIDVKMDHEGMNADAPITPENFLLSLPEDIRRELNQRHFTFDDTHQLSQAPAQPQQPSPSEDLNLDDDSSSITRSPHDATAYQAETEMQNEPPIAPPPQQHAAGKCIYCNTRKVSIILLPCRHLCLCSECATEVGVTDCPVCQTHVQYVSEVFY